MRTSSALMTLCFVALAPAVVYSQESAASVWRCEAGKFEREIRLFESQPAGPPGSAGPSSSLACRVLYAKNGNTELLWQARNDPGFCRPRVLGLVEKLTNAGFSCEQSGQSAGAHPADAAVTTVESAVPKAEDVPAPVVAETAPPDTGDAALRGLLEKYYEDNYLDAMVAAIPNGFSPLPERGALSAGSDGVLHVGPPNHFIKTLSDGSYVLVNTLHLEQGGASSFVNLGFLVRDKRYRFLGYATAHSVSAVAVQDAGKEQVSLMVSTIVAPSCDVSRRSQSMSWEPVLEVHYIDVSQASANSSACSQ